MCIFQGFNLWRAKRPTDPHGHHWGHNIITSSANTGGTSTCVIKDCENVWSSPASDSIGTFAVGFIDVTFCSQVWRLCVKIGLHIMAELAPFLEKAFPFLNNWWAQLFWCFQSFITRSLEQSHIDILMCCPHEHAFRRAMNQYSAFSYHVYKHWQIL